MIFGKQGCKETRDSKIGVYFTDGDSIIVGEQLTVTEAKKLYSELKDKFSDKKSFIEVTMDDDRIYFIPKNNIELIKFVIE